MNGIRSQRIERKTAETDISLTLRLPPGAGVSSIDTPIPFLSHMLQAFARHGAFGLDVNASGDIEVDGHHTVEDTGLVLGQALDGALGTRAGIRRYGHFSLCMDETLVDCALDLGGRPYLVFDVPVIGGRWIGDFDCDLVREFFQAAAVTARMNLHLHLRTGGNAHHVVEACFKAFARALRMAVELDPELAGALPSTKGAI